MGGNEHIDLVSYIVNPKKKFSRRILLDLNDAKAVEEHKEKIGAKFHQELSAAATRGDTLIISSERLFALVTFEHEIRELRDLLMQYCESFEVVCYIRPQHEFAFSLHSTMLRKGINRPNALPDFDVPSREARKYNYNRVLLFWERHFPSAKFTIRRFTKKHLIDGNAVHDFANVAGEPVVTAKIADSALNRLEVDALGLDAMDRRYLHMIADIYRGGPVGVEALAAGLSEPRDTIEDVVEPYLLQLGLIARTARGRCLNAPGWKHLGLNPPAGSQDGLFDA